MADAQAPRATQPAPQVAEPAPEVPLPRGYEPEEAQEYFRYLDDYFIDHLPKEQWNLDPGVPATELAWVVGVAFLLWGLAFVPRRQRSKGDHYPVSVYNEITERGGKIAKWELLVYLVIIAVAGYYFVRVLTQGYVYEGV